MTSGQTYKLRVVEFQEHGYKKYALACEGITYSENVFIKCVETSLLLFLPEAPRPSSFEISIHDTELRNQVVNSRLYEWSPEIVELGSLYKFYLVPDESLFQGITVKRIEGGRFSFELKFGFDSENWKRPWSFKEYLNEFGEILKGQDSSSTGLSLIKSHGPGGLDSLRVGLREPNITNTINEEILKNKQALGVIHTLVEKSLLSTLNAGSVVTHFDFPEDVKVPCEQYLLYFVQFLKDIGVEATAELHHEAGEVLFAVTPADKDEALDKIRAALDTYLHLAASPVDTVSVLRSDIAVQRLSANIQHLQGQLTLAHAVLQAKDATIQLQQTTIARQRQMLTGEIVLESMKDVTPKPKDSEEVLGGLAEITKYEGKGFNLNLPEAFRRLRQLFSEKKSEKK